MSLILLNLSVNEYYYDLVMQLLKIFIFIILFHLIVYTLEIKNPMTALFSNKLLNNDVFSLILALWLTTICYNLIFDRIINIKNNYH